MIAEGVQRWREQRGSYRLIGEPIATRLYDVVEICDDATPKAFVRAHHYAISYPAARYRFGLFRGAELVGVAVFSHPVNEASLAVLPGRGGERIELGRFVLLDDVPANGETWFLARCFAKLRAEGIVGVVSFSDPFPRATSDGRRVFPGHVGTIYQAFNGVFLGRARADTVRLLPDGTVLHNRAIAKVRALERGWRYVSARLETFGATPLHGDPAAWLARWVPALTRRVRHPGNLKYAWGLTRESRRALPRSLPYPKIAIPPPAVGPEGAHERRQHGA